MAKMYTNTTRKPMMGGGYARKTMSYGGSTRKKMSNGKTATSASTASTMTDAERQKLIRRRAQLQKEVQAGMKSPEVLDEMRRTIEQISGQLGESATPGRMNVDK